eukprot:5240276-Pyramimonas_sp.AAC.1
METTTTTARTTVTTTARPGRLLWTASSPLCHWAGGRRRRCHDMAKVSGLGDSSGPVTWFSGYPGRAVAR